MTDDYKPYRWQYQKSNRLDENLRKATILRDGCRCQECGKSNCILEVHHIRARRYGGANTIGNLITLCKKCHDKTESREKVKNTPSDVLVSRNLCECQSRNYANVLHR